MSPLDVLLHESPHKAQSTLRAHDAVCFIVHAALDLLRVVLILRPPTPALFVDTFPIFRSVPRALREPRLFVRHAVRSHVLALLLHTPLFAYLSRFLERHHRRRC
eukprot:531404-Pleurochrysis_carterae.AAC.2